MKKELLTILVIIGIVSVLDFVWLSLRRKFYMDSLEAVQDEEVNIRWESAMVAYLLMIFSIYYFAVRNKKEWYNAMISGALLGLVIYGIYNATNYATLTRYTKEYSMQDTAWGITLYAVSSAVAKMAYDRL